MNGVSLFANVGIGETYAHEYGINIVVANELLKDRADFYKFVHPNTEVVAGDITKESVYNTTLELAKKHNCEFILATPPCQGMSNAGRKREGDERNILIKYVLSFAQELLPKYILIENVPGMLKTFVDIDGKDQLFFDHIVDTLGEKYKIKSAVMDAADYGTPQYRKRAIFLLSRNDVELWEFPERQKHITVREAIGHLPTLESGESSEIPFHRAKVHNLNHIETMRHTPTGHTAFDNEKYYPKRADGKRVRGYKTTYKRMDWDKPAPTITMGNGSISSQNNVHPGRLLEDGTYSDARVLTLKELFILTGLPDDWTPPDVSDNLIRQVIGECLLPKLVNSLLTTLPKE